MAFDIRLACLMFAINEDWADLEAKEVNGTLVVRLKDGIAIIELQKEREPKKRGCPPGLRRHE